MPQKRFLETGRIVNTHGIRGEVRLQPWSDSPGFLLGIKNFYIDEKCYKAERARVHRDMVILKLEGVDSVNDAMTMKNKVVFIDRNDVRLEEGSYFIQDAVGLPVFDMDGAEIGKLTEVLELPGGSVFVVNGEAEHLIPVNGGFIKEVDIENGKIIVELIDGM
jgi:16S rRNA processing protein RimM